MFHESPKELWKNNNFENMGASFLRRCQNTLWQNCPEMMHFQAWKICFLTNITLCIKIQIHQVPQKDRLNPSFVKDLGVVSGKMVLKWSFMRRKFSFFFLTKLKKKKQNKKCHLCHRFCSNSDFHRLGTPKWPSEPQFGENY